MKRFPSRHAFTLIEMITVITIIAILSGLVLSLAGLVQNKGARAKAAGDIHALKSACESYKTDNGGYPQDNPANAGGPSVTNDLDPKTQGNPLSTATPSYAASSLFLYKQLTGDDVTPNGKIDSTETGRKYLTDFFKASRFDSNFRTTGVVSYIVDPFGYSYGYSTAGLLMEQEYRALLGTDASAARPTKNSKNTQGYNPTFDLWSTAGGTAKKSGETEDEYRSRWIKNW